VELKQCVGKCKWPTSQCSGAIIKAFRSDA